MMLLPIFIMDHPNRTISILLFWTALFILISQLVKDAPVCNTDTIHAIEYFFAGSCVTYVVLRIRLQSLTHLDQLHYYLGHDRETKSQNRYAFEEQIAELAGRPVTLFMFDVDQLMLFSDFYGKTIADDIMKHFMQTLGKYFGAYFSARGVGCSPNVVKHLGVTLLPQAGVALGMCVTARQLGDVDGALVRNIILFSVLIYELVGPSLTKMALTKAGDIQAKSAELLSRREKLLY